MLHIWIDAKTETIMRTLHDNGDELYKAAEKHFKKEGMTYLHRVVVTDGKVRVVPPGEE